VPVRTPRIGEQDVVLEAVAAVAGQELPRDRFDVDPNRAVALDLEIVEAERAEMGDVHAPQRVEGGRQRRGEAEPGEIEVEVHDGNRTPRTDAPRVMGVTSPPWLPMSCRE
jgi:hypothetical protein